ncbi:S-layer homology domain-containing protein [Nitriliruptor alkaliphilus]|uniref:S-layer homology domain-containing protein n=1 Tax=Nitriliruptor alkaliphilus TaxID=427918 RepID=UPI0014706D20|nr:S-layer homology domain-containing protein [Nitriliruptor alkaliphilus]
MRKPRRKTVLLAVIAMLAIAVPAAAQSGGFRDVGSGYVHAKAVDQMRSAGITVGCGDGSRYCPNDPVTRGAMASFLTRGGAQGYGANNATTLAAGSGNVNGVPVTLDVTGAGESGGRQQIVLQGSVTVTASQELDGCEPCEVEAYIYRARGSVVGPRSFASLDTSGGGATVSLPVDWATRIDSARTEQYRIAVFVDGTTATAGLRADGTLNAVTAPFGRSSSG